MQKKTFIIAAALIAVAVALAAVITAAFGEKYDAEDANRVISIKWEMVNLREDHSTSSDVIAELHQGDTVTLTGYSYEYVSAEDLPTESWQQIRTSSGQIGRVVTSSIKWH